MQPESLDQLQKAFSSTANLAIAHPDKVSGQQYQNLEILGKLLLAEGRGAHPDERGNTPADLMARMAEKHPTFKSIVERFDQRETARSR